MTSVELREDFLRAHASLARDPLCFLPAWIRDVDPRDLVDLPLIFLTGGDTDHAMWLFLNHERASSFQRLAIVDERRAGRDPEGREILDLRGFLNLVHELGRSGTDFLCINFSMEKDDYLLYGYMAEVLGFKMLDWAEAFRLPGFDQLQSGATNDLVRGIAETPGPFLEAESLLADERSKVTLYANLLFRLTLRREYLWPSAMPLWCSYFHSDLIRLGEDEVFVDVGAYDGDTLRDFVFSTRGRFLHYYGFEPSSHNFRALAHTRDLLRLPPAKATLEEKAVSSFSGESGFVADQGGGSHIVEDVRLGESILGADRSQRRVRPVPVVSLDEYFSNGHEARPISLLKMDIEGEEPKALAGARGLLREHKPRLAICAYHFPLDIPTISRYLADLDVGYTFGLRHHNSSHWDTVLYAYRG